MIIDNTISICLSDSSHSSWINAASSSSSYELVDDTEDDGYDIDELDDERLVGNGIGIA